MDPNKDRGGQLRVEVFGQKGKGLNATRGRSDGKYVSVTDSGRQQIELRSLTILRD